LSSIVMQFLTLNQFLKVRWNDNNKS
jgi:hypothetical protein